MNKVTKSIPRVVVVNGDVCSGSSTLARTLSSNTGYELIDVGQDFRKELLRAPSQNVHELSLALNALVSQRIRTNERTIIEGRLVGIQSLGLPGVLRLLCVAPQEVVTQRFMTREGLSSVVQSQLALKARYVQDEHVLMGAWGVSRDDIFDPTLYDRVLDTSLAQPEEIVTSLTKEGLISNP